MELNSKGSKGHMSPCWVLKVRGRPEKPPGWKDILCTPAAPIRASCGGIIISWGFAGKLKTLFGPHLFHLKGLEQNYNYLNNSKHGTAVLFIWMDMNNYWRHFEVTRAEIIHEPREVKTSIWRKKKKIIIIQSVRMWVFKGNTKCNKK